MAQSLAARLGPWLGVAFSFLALSAPAQAQQERPTFRATCSATAPAAEILPVDLSPPIAALRSAAPIHDPSVPLRQPPTHPPGHDIHDLSSLLNASEMVFVGTLIAAPSRVQTGREFTVTDYSFSIEEWFKGGNGASEMTFTCFGGVQPDGLVVTTSDSLWFTRKHRYLVFVKHNSADILLPFLTAYQLLAGQDGVADQDGHAVLEVKDSRIVVDRRARTSSMVGIPHVPSTTPPGELSQYDPPGQMIQRKSVATPQPPASVASLLAALRAHTGWSSRPPKGPTTNFDTPAPSRDPHDDGGPQFDWFGWRLSTATFYHYLPNDQSWSDMSGLWKAWNAVVSNNPDGPDTLIAAKEDANGNPIRDHKPHLYDFQNDCAVVSSELMELGGYPTWEEMDNEDKRVLGRVFPTYNSDQFYLYELLETDVMIRPEVEQDKHLFRQVMTHELGHALGMHHETEHYSIMWPAAFDIAPNDSSAWYTRTDDCAGLRDNLNWVNANYPGTWVLDQWTDMATYAQTMTYLFDYGYLPWESDITSQLLYPGDQFETAYMHVENRGTNPASDVWLKVYFSTDYDFNDSDYLVGIVYFGTYPGSSYTADLWASCLVPIDIPPGPYYVGWTISTSTPEKTTSNNQALMKRRYKNDYNPVVVNVLCPLPDAPAWLTATDGDCGAVTLDWPPVDDAEGYQVWRSLTDKSIDAIKIDETGDNETKYVDNTGSCLTDYWYWVKTETCDASEFSVSNRGWRKCEPDSPATVTASDGASCTTVEVKWNDGIPWADYYRIYRGATDDPDDAVWLADDNGSPYFDHPPDDNLYHYWVTSKGSCGEGDWNGSDMGSMSLGEFPDPPVGIDASDDTCYGITLTWKDDPFLDYVILRAMNNDPDEAIEIADDIDHAPYVDNSVDAGTPYWYWVQAANECGQASDPSVSDSGQRPFDQPVIDGQPQSAEVCEGANAVFSVSATGTGALVFAWRVNGEDVTDDDGVDSMLTLKEVSTELDGAQILCDVTDDCGTATSHTAVLAVTACNDCNGNGIDDATDIASGTSLDCDNDGTPDECQMVPTILQASDGQDLDKFAAVAVRGDTAVVGAEGFGPDGNDPGAAYGFRRVAGTWVPQGHLPPGDAKPGDLFGAAVGVSGNLAVVSAPRHDAAGDSSGAAYVFRYSGGKWAQEVKLEAPDAATKDQFGKAVGIYGDTIVIGAWLDDTQAGANAGSVNVFRYNNGAWPLEAQLFASDAAAGDLFGQAVEIRGDWLAIGAPAKAAKAGAAYIFKRSNGTWKEQYKLLSPAAQPGDQFGTAVTLTTSRAVIGAPFAAGAGAAYVFVKVNAAWNYEATLTNPAGHAADEFGRAVTLSGSRAVVGSPKDDAVGIDSGAAFVYVRGETGWSSAIRLSAAIQDAGDYLGVSCAIDAETLMTGAAFTHFLGGDQGAVFAYEFATDCSACYPDFDGNGTLDLFDFLGYVNAFNAGEATADCDHNGAFDLFDFLCFLNQFNAGC